MTLNPEQQKATKALKAAIQKCHEAGLELTPNFPDNVKLYVTPLGMNIPQGEHIEDHAISVYL